MTKRKPLRLEAGKAYRTRDGRKVAVLFDDATEHMSFKTSLGWHYSDGRYTAFGPSECDIVAEWGLPAADGWIPWAGGECPVPPETVVEAKNRDGNSWLMTASSGGWSHRNDDGDIIAYRVVPKLEGQITEASSSPVCIDLTKPFKTWTQALAEVVEADARALHVSILRQHSCALSCIMAAWEAGVV